MLGPPKPRLDEPTVVSLEELVPADHFYRHLEAINSQAPPAEAGLETMGIPD